MLTEQTACRADGAPSTLKNRGRGLFSLPDTVLAKEKFEACSVS